VEPGGRGGKVNGAGSNHVDPSVANADGSVAQLLWVGDQSSTEQPDWGE
jgi:hypothetical protein